MVATASVSVALIESRSLDDAQIEGVEQGEFGRVLGAA
jgi:hypothetical protein